MTPQEEIAELKRKLAEAQKECDEQARLNGMGAERELALQAKLAEAEFNTEAARITGIREVPSAAALLARAEAAERERDLWKADAGRYCDNADFWKRKCAAMAEALEKIKGQALYSSDSVPALGRIDAIAVAALASQPAPAEPAKTLHSRCCEAPQTPAGLCQRCGYSFEPCRTERCKPTPEAP